MIPHLLDQHTRSPLAIHRTATTALGSVASDNSVSQTLVSDSENPDCSDDPLRQWSIPFSVITPELVRQTKGGLASLLLGRAVS